MIEDILEWARNGITLWVITVVLIVVTATQLITGIYARQVTNRLDTAGAQARESQLYAVEFQNKPIPAASLYATIVGYSQDIKEISGVVGGVRISSVEDLTKILQHRVYVRVTEVSLGEFTLVVEGAD